MLRKLRLKRRADVLPLPCNNCVNMTSFFTVHTDIHVSRICFPLRYTLHSDNKYLGKKRYKAKRFLSELRTMPWSLRGLNDANKEDRRDGVSRTNDSLR